MATSYRILALHRFPYFQLDFIQIPRFLQIPPQPGSSSRCLGAGVAVPTAELSCAFSLAASSPGHLAALGDEVQLSFFRCPSPLRSSADDPCGGTSRNQEQWHQDSLFVCSYLSRLWTSDFANLDSHSARRQECLPLGISYEPTIFDLHTYFYFHLTFHLLCRIFF
jgi:hypothetical protein